MVVQAACLPYPGVHFSGSNSATPFSNRNTHKHTCLDRIFPFLDYHSSGRPFSKRPFARHPGRPSFVATPFLLREPPAHFSPFGCSSTAQRAFSPRARFSVGKSDVQQAQRGGKGCFLARSLSPCVIGRCISDLEKSTAIKKKHTKNAFMFGCL